MSGNLSGVAEGMPEDLIHRFPVVVMQLATNWLAYKDIHTHIYMCICVCMCVYVYMYVCVYVCVYI